MFTKELRKIKVRLRDLGFLSLTRLVVFVTLYVLITSFVASLPYFNVITFDYEVKFICLLVLFFLIYKISVNALVIMMVLLLFFDVIKERNGILMFIMIIYIWCKLAKELLWKKA